MKVLITGAFGFQGSHLAQRLINKGYEVTMFGTWSERSLDMLNALRLDEDALASSIFVPVFGSITDKESVEKVVREQDVIFHLAARMQVDESIQYPRETLETNLFGTQNLLESMRRVSPKAKFIHVSSCEVYGGQGKPLTELSPFLPNSPYAASKVAADTLVTAYNKTYDLDTVIVRPVNVYGPRQRRGKFGNVIPIFVDLARQGKSLPVFGDGSQRREFIHIDDLVDAYELVLNNTYPGEMYNIGTGERISVSSIAVAVSKHFNVEIVKRAPRVGEVRDFEIISTKFQISLNWEPQIKFSDGLQQYMETEPLHW